MKTSFTSSGEGERYLALRVSSPRLPVRTVLTVLALRLVELASVQLIPNLKRTGIILRPILPTLVLDPYEPSCFREKRELIHALRLDLMEHLYRICRRSSQSGQGRVRVDC